METNKIKTFQSVSIARLTNASHHIHFILGLHVLVFKNRDHFMFSFGQLIRRQIKSRHAIFMNKTVLSTKSIPFLKAARYLRILAEG
jgi:hypothetical protein